MNGDTMGKRLKGIDLLLLLFLVGFPFYLSCLEASESAPSGEPLVFSPEPEERAFAVDPEKSSIAFLLDGNVHNTHGSVKKIEGRVTLAISPDAALKKAEVSISMDADDLDTDNEKRDTRMKDKFLEVKKYPRIDFTSTDVTSLLGTEEIILFQAGNPLTIDLPGKLALHGVTKVITVEATLSLVGDRFIAKGKTTLNLKDFNIKNPSMMLLRVSNEVQITFHIESIRII